MHSKAMKHSTPRWSERRHAKRKLCKANVGVFGHNNRSLRRPIGCKKHEMMIKTLSSSHRLVPMQMDPSKDIPRNRTAREKGHFWPCLTDCENYVRHLQ